MPYVGVLPRRRAGCLTQTTGLCDIEEVESVWTEVCHAYRLEGQRQTSLGVNALATLLDRVRETVEAGAAQPFDGTVVAGAV